MTSYEKYFESWQPFIDKSAATENDCGKCYTCLNTHILPSGFPVTACMMICCHDCGNKRCPKATHHDNECTGSNDTGQKGSRYE